MIRRMLFSLGLAATALVAPASAQSPVAQAGAHVQFALTECLQNYRQPDALHGIFTANGFIHTVEDYGGGEVIHWYAPSDGAASIAVLGLTGTSGPQCRISTDHIDVAQMLPFARAVAGRVMANTQIADGSPEGERIMPGSPAAQSYACSGFHMLVPRSMIWVRLERAGNDGTCLSDGTSQVVVLL